MLSSFLGCVVHGNEGEQSPLWSLIVHCYRLVARVNEQYKVIRNQYAAVLGYLPEGWFTWAEGACRGTFIPVWSFLP
jgi:hypothetical protein